MLYVESIFRNLMALLWKDIWSQIFLCNFVDKKMGNTKLFNARHIDKLLAANYDFTMDTKYINHYNTQYPPTWCVSKHMASLTEEDIRDGLELDAPLIFELLEIGGGKMSLCGGGALRAMTNTYESGQYKDFDFFFHTTEQEADDILEKCLLHIHKTDLGYTFIRSQGVITCIKKGAPSIQFIKRLYHTADQILLGFDMAGCQYGWNPIDGLFTTLAGMFAFATGSYPVDLSQYTTSHNVRLAKYANKGFMIMLPGLDFADSPSEDFSNDGVKFSLQKDGSYTIAVNEHSPISDYCINHYNPTTLVDYPFMFNFNSDTPQGILTLDEETVKSSLGKMLSWELPNYCAMNMRIRKFIGNKIAQFTTAHIVEMNKAEAEKIWVERQEEYSRIASDLAIKLNKSLRWKVDNPGCQRFGKFNPRYIKAKDWYGEHHKPIIVGITQDMYQAWMDCRKNIAYMKDIPTEINRLICNQWLQGEARKANKHLLRYYDCWRKEDVEKKIV